MNVPRIVLPRWCHSIRLKLAGGISVLIALISTFVLFFFPSKLEEQALAAFAEKAEAVANMMASNITPALVFDDRPAVCDVVIGAKRNPDLDYVMVMDDAESVIASFNSHRATELHYELVSEGKVSDDGLTYQVVVPIKSSEGMHGKVYLGLSLKELKNTVAQSRKTIGWVSLGISIAGILIVIVLSTIITKPLVKMLKVAEKITAGDWKQRANISSRDEVGHLETVFDKMVDNVELAYEELRQSEERNRILSEGAFEGISVTEESKIIDTNIQFARMLGYERSQLIGLEVLELVHSEDHEFVLERRRQGTSEPYEHRMIRRDGAMIFVEVRAQNCLYQGRNVRMSAVRDITERKLAERELQFQKARFEQLFENAPIGIVLCDHTERILHTNSVFQTMFGHSLHELCGNKLNDVLLPENLDEEGTAYANRVLGGEPIYGETVRQRKDGSLIDVDVFGIPIVVNGESVGLFGMYVDTSQRKKAERELQLLAHTVASTKDCVTITDLDDRIIFVNDAFTKHYGYAREEVVGKNIAMLRSARTPTVVADGILPTTLAGGWYGEIYNCRKDGSEFPIELWTSVVRNEVGEPIAMVGVARDVTERKLTEYRQAELMKDLEDTNKELNDFAYIVSHDLKAPLRAIGSLVNWLSNDYGGKLGDDGNEMMKVLLGRTKRMHALIDGILRYSRIGRTRGESVPIDLDKVVPDIIEMIDPPSHIRVDIEPSLPTVEGDTTRMQQVFQNLLSNSIKFMDKPDGQIRIGCERENGHWKFSVADNGPGIDRKHFDRIFQIFQTLSSRDEFESTGIGLAIVKKTVEVCGGRIWLESEVGKGTTFYFTLPVSVN